MYYLSLMLNKSNIRGLTLICFTFLLLLTQSCKIKIPKKDNSLSDRQYKNYSEDLVNSYKENDLFKRAISLANLKYDPKVVYKLLQKSIGQHDSVCLQLYYYKYISETSNFNTIIVKHDKQKFINICNLCESVYKYQTYFKERKVLELAYAEKIKFKELNLNPNSLDKVLISNLEEVHKRDQAYRGENYINNIKLQNINDSINLITIKRIFKEYNGYPCVEIVGYNNIIVPWLVLQHQSNVYVRQEYTQILEEAVNKNCLSKQLLDAYKDRTSDFIYYEQKNKK